MTEGLKLAKLLLEMISTFSSDTELKRICSWIAIVHCRFRVMLVLLLEVKEAYEILCYVRNL